MSKIVQIIPASEGYFALDKYFLRKSSDEMNDLTKGKFRIEKVPVIGWRIETDTDWDGKDYHYIATVDPISAESHSGFYDGEVLTPEGFVLKRGLKYWNTYSEFISEIGAEE